MSKGCLLYTIAIVAHLAALLASVALCYMYATTIWREDHGRVGENNPESAAGRVKIRNILDLL